MDDNKLEQLATAQMEVQGRPFSRDEVIDIINSIMGKMDHSEQDVQLYKELKELSDYIHTARKEISQIAPVNFDQEEISSATDELDAVVKATEVATGTIMDTCEIIETEITTIGDEVLKEKLLSQITNIYEACGFQDITGQRISKVVKTLQHIEAQVDVILTAMGDDPNAQGANKESSDEEVVLENGPQLPENAISQDDIDALLASFD